MVREFTAAKRRGQKKCWMDFKSDLASMLSFPLSLSALAQASLLDDETHLAPRPLLS